MFFSFVGEVNFDLKDDAKVPGIRNLTSKNGGKGIGINASVAASKNNRAFVELSGWQSENFKTKDTESNNIVIAWEDRLDPEIIKKVSPRKRNVISLDKDDRHEFITTYDLGKFIKDNIDKINGKRFLVTGETSENFYNGKESKRFEINSLYRIDEQDERKNKLEINPPVIYFTQKSIDTADFKSDKKVVINGYTREYIRPKYLGTDNGAAKYVKQQFILDCSRIDFDNEKQVAKLNFNLGMLGLKYKDGKITNKLKDTEYYSNSVRVSFFQGAEEIGDAAEITYDMLTATQKQKVDLGMAEISDYAAKGTVYGNRITVYRIVDFPCTGEYANGMVTLTGDVEVFEDEIFTFPSDKDFMNKPENIDDELPFGTSDDDKKEEEEDKPKKKTSKAKKAKEVKEEEEDDELPFDVEEEDDEEEGKASSEDEDWDMFG